MFICGEEFVCLEKIVEERGNTHNLSFSKKHQDEKTSSLIKPQDLTKFVQIPEFVNRFPFAIKLEKLTTDDLENILTKPKKFTHKTV